MNAQHRREYSSTISPERQRRVFSTRRWRSGLVLGIAAAFVSSASAQGEASKPYELHIVVHVAQNRLLTDVFRDRIERELHDGVQAALGDMGRVKVMHEHPRLPEVLSRGLKQALDGWSQRDDVKTHFVLIDFSGVHYEIQARQYDGTIGRASPVVRRDRTRDRDFVAKAAALLLKQDFGVLGTVLSGAEGPQEIVKVELRGGVLGDLSRWVQNDDVFALAPPGGGTTPALRWSLLQVQEPPREDARDGTCVCRFFHRYRVVGGIAGYRCIKLGTIQAPLRLRWVQEVPGGGTRPLKVNTTLTVDIRRHGFSGEEATKLSHGVKPNGTLETVRDGDKGLFQNVAFLVVSSGAADRTQPQVPVALVDEEPVFIEINASQDPSTLFSMHRAAWQSDVYETWLVQVSLFKDLESLSAKGEARDKIIEKAERGLKRSQSERETLTERKQELLKESSPKPLDTTREDRRLQEMADGERALEQFIAQQKKIEATENDPKMKRWRSEVERAKLLEKDLEIGKAIVIYQGIQKEGFQDPDLDKRVKTLQEMWKTADAEHEDARNFIYRVWPTLDTARLEENLVQAHKALDKCKSVRDLVSIKKLLKGAEIHADRLTKELSELSPELIIEHEKQARAIKSTSAELIKLGKEAQEFLQRNQPADK
jgi:hypothetical protein